MGARAVLFEGNKKPFTAATALISRNIGQAISLGFIRITNEDVIDQTPRLWCLPDPTRAPWT